MFLCSLIKMCVKTGGALATRAKFPSAQKKTERKYIKRTFPPSNIAATSLPEHCGGKKSKGLKKRRRTITL